jgi:hypothetical protein
LRAQSFVAGAAIFIARISVSVLRFSNLLQSIVDARAINIAGTNQLIGAGGKIRTPQGNERKSLVGHFFDWLANDRERV